MITIYIQWRTNLRLDEGLVDAITPQRILGLRTLLNSTGMDIMYYTSPLFRMEIWSALQYELNRLYEMFTSRHPNFEANGGKVSIISHSLGELWEEWQKNYQKKNWWLTK